MSHLVSLKFVTGVPLVRCSDPSYCRVVTFANFFSPHWILSEVADHHLGRWPGASILPDWCHGNPLQLRQDRQWTQCRLSPRQHSLQFSVIPGMVKLPNPDSIYRILSALFGVFQLQTNKESSIDTSLCASPMRSAWDLGWLLRSSKSRPFRQSFRLYWSSTHAYAIFLMFPRLVLSSLMRSNSLACSAVWCPDPPCFIA